MKYINIFKTKQRKLSKMFIVFEGIDGSGKSTQVENLVNWLKEKGKDVYLTRQPTRGKIGMLLKEEYIKHGVEFPIIDTLLFAADKNEHMELEVKPALSENKIVVCDRYVYSTVAYQELDMDWIININKDLLKPDLVLFIDLDPEVSITRTFDQKTIKFENLGVLKKVRERYLEAFEKYPDHNIKIIDGSGTKEEVFELIKKEVEAQLE